MPLNHILPKCTAGYKLIKSQKKINHLIYMDEIKLFAKNEKELETLIQTVRIYSQNIGMEFGIEKCVMLVMKSSKRHLTEEVELPNQVVIRALGEKKPTNTWRYWKLTPSNKWKWKKNFKKSISEEPENYSSQMDKYLGYPPRKILGTILEVDQRRTLINGLKNKKTNDHA